MAKQRQAGGVGFISMVVLFDFFELVFYRIGGGAISDLLFASHAFYGGGVSIGFHTTLDFYAPVQPPAPFLTQKTPKYLIPDI
jgi:hypothetical protein